MYLLRRYLQIKYQSEDEANNKLVKLINALKAINLWHKQNMKRFLKEVSTNSTPLLHELYDNILTKPNNSIEYSQN